MDPRHIGAAAAVVTLLLGCGAPDERLSGTREAVGYEPSSRNAIVSAADAVPLRLASQTTNSTWTHRLGTASHRSPHPALSSTPVPIWTASIGQGNTRRNRIASEPIVAAGAIFAMDSTSRVTATSTDGAQLWSVDLTPKTETAQQAGSGGLAFGANKIFATTGFGELVALDPSTGGEIWTQDLDAFGGAAPTYFDGRVYVAARDSMGWTVDAQTGRILWQVIGSPSPSNLLGGPGVAVNERLAIFPFASGELVAVFRKGGIRLWNSTILGKRQGRAIARVTDIAGDPVIADNVVYATNPSGRMVALDMDDGTRLWTANEGSYGPPTVAGTSLFVVNDQNELVRLDRATGARIWSQPLALYIKDKERQRAAIFAHYGPVLAGGQLWVASTDDALRAYDPQSGRVIQTFEIAGGAASAPVVAGETLYVLSRKGQLHAFR